MINLNSAVSQPHAEPSLEGGALLQAATGKKVPNALGQVLPNRFSDSQSLGSFKELMAQRSAATDAESEAVVADLLASYNAKPPLQARLTNPLEQGGEQAQAAKQKVLDFVQSSFSEVRVNDHPVETDLSAAAQPSASLAAAPSEQAFVVAHPPSEGFVKELNRLVSQLAASKQPERFATDLASHPLTTTSEKTSLSALASQFSALVESEFGSVPQTPKQWQDFVNQNLSAEVPRSLKLVLNDALSTLNMALPPSSRQPAKDMANAQTVVEAPLNANHTVQVVDNQVQLRDKNQADISSAVQTVGASSAKDMTNAQTVGDTMPADGMARDLTAEQAAPAGIRGSAAATAMTVEDAATNRVNRVERTLPPENSAVEASMNANQASKVTDNQGHRFEGEKLATLSAEREASTTGKPFPDADQVNAESLSSRTTEELVDSGAADDNHSEAMALSTNGLAASTESARNENSEKAVSSEQWIPGEPLEGERRQEAQSPLANPQHSTEFVEKHDSKPVQLERSGQAADSEQPVAREQVSALTQAQGSIPNGSPAESGRAVPSSPVPQPGQSSGQSLGQQVSNQQAQSMSGEGRQGESQSGTQQESRQGARQDGIISAAKSADHSNDMNGASTENATNKTASNTQQLSQTLFNLMAQGKAADSAPVSQMMQAQQRGMEQQASMRAMEVSTQQNALQLDADGVPLSESGVGERRASLPPGLQSIPLPVKHPQWGQALGQRVAFMANSQLQQAQITLNPEKLGPIQIKLHMDRDQQMQVSLNAQQGTTREAIEAAIPRLREMLEQSGVQLGSVDVGDFSQFSEEQMQGDDSSQSSESAGSTVEGSGEETLSSQEQIINLESDQLVDYYA